MIAPKTFTVKVGLSIILASASFPVLGKDNAKPHQAISSVLVAEHALQGQEFQLTQVTLWDRTDKHDDLVRVKTQLIADGKPIARTGNIFVVENASNQQGLIFIRQSPMPTSRPLKPELDVEVQKNKDHLTVKLYRANYEEEKELWHVIPYQGEAFERIRALQTWQRSLRPDSPLYRIPKFITNTWGDRSKDARVSEQFIIKEIEAAKEIGVDVVRIDDGWQTGLSGNSAFNGEMKTKGLTGFWGVSDSFWNVNLERFPNGLEPVLNKARKEGVEIGLWYAPDSDNELANWEKDADTILELYKAYGIRFFKIDGLNAGTPLAQQRVTQLLSKVMEKSSHEILLMLDITGNHKRPGFLGAIPYGNLFVENRYTDKGSYWPHRTLRNLWRLSHWVNPGRLRFETLNNTRKTEHKKYENNPLAPKNYPADYLFASVMMSNPLGWYEASNLPKDYRAKLTPLVKVWRQHRQAIFESSIIPIGQEPSGHSWTGFMTLKENEEANYLLCLREFTETDNYTYKLPLEINHKLRILQGNGTATVNGNELSVTVKEKPGYIFIKIEQDVRERRR
jgi:alpha-galactosidase